jgi:hypothetical protein
LALYASGLCLAAAVFLVARRLTIGPLPVTYDIKHMVGNLLKAFMLSVSVFGQSNPFRFNFLYPWYAFLCFNLLYYLKTGKNFQSIIVCFICMLLSCIHCAIEMRVNLLLLPISFFALGFGIISHEIMRRSKTGAFVEIGFLAALLILCIYMHRLQQYCLHPLEVTQISREYDYTFGEYATSTVPQERKKYVRNKFKMLGMNPETFDYEKLRAETVLTTPTQDQRLFRSPFRFLYP